MKITKETHKLVKSLRGQYEELKQVPYRKVLGMILGGDILVKVLIERIEKLESVEKIETVETIETIKEVETKELSLEEKEEEIMKSLKMECRKDNNCMTRIKRVYQGLDISLPLSEFKEILKGMRFNEKIDLYTCHESYGEESEKWGIKSPNTFGPLLFIGLRD